MTGHQLAFEFSAAVRSRRTRAPKAAARTAWWDEDLEVDRLYPNGLSSVRRSCVRRPVATVAVTGAVL